MKKFSRIFISIFGGSIIAAGVYVCFVSPVSSLAGLAIILILWGICLVLAVW